LCGGGGELTELTRDPWKSMLSEALKESRNNGNAGLCRFLAAMPETAAARRTAQNAPQAHNRAFRSESGFRLERRR